MEIDDEQPSKADVIWLTDMVIDLQRRLEESVRAEARLFRALLAARRLTFDDVEW